MMLTSTLMEEADMSRSVQVLAWLIVAALLAPRIAMGAGCASSYVGQEPVSSMSTDETGSSGWTSAWNVAGREDTRSTECIAGPLSSTNKPGMPQSNTWEGGNPVLAPSLVLSLSSLNPMQARVCPAVIGVQR
jgi:hypothetical protein